MVADTPDTPTIQTLVDLVNTRDDLRRADREWTAADTLKNVIVKLKHPDGRIEPLAVGVPGDREVDMKRLEAQVGPAEIAPFGEDDFAKNEFLVKGYIGPGALGSDKPAGIRYLIDPRIVDGTQWITGADQPGRHVLYLTAGRDFVADGTVEAAEVVDGDVCPVCQSAMEIARGIEIGHIFQLGRKYATALGLTVLDQNGKQQVVTMGSYGIGVSRAVAAIAEMNCDDKGLIWPIEVSPADVHIVATGKPGDPQLPAAERLAARLRGRRPAGAARRPRRGVAGHQVQRRRVDRGSDHHHRRPRACRRCRRGQGSTHGRTSRRHHRQSGVRVTYCDSLID